MSHELKNNEEKIQYIINHLQKMKWLEFINSDEVSACNLVIKRLRKSLSKDIKISK
jgi:hypothetical protein